MKVSVALCTHNGASYIERQLVSILEQTMLPNQVIVSDDSSSDNTLELVRGLANQFDANNVELKIFSNTTPLGVGANFFKAMSETSHEIIFLADQDDVWLPTKVAQTIGVFEHKPQTLLVHTNADLVDEKGGGLGRTLFQDLRISQAELEKEASGKAIEVILTRNTVTGATIALRRELVKLSSPYVGPCLHDEWLGLVAAALGRLEVLPSSTIFYRQHENNQVGSDKLTWSVRFDKLRAERQPRNQRLLETAINLKDHLRTCGQEIKSGTDFLIEQKVLHEVTRCSYPTKRFSRIMPIIKEWRSNRYTLVGRGLQDVLRDLVQPAGKDEISNAI